MKIGVTFGLFALIFATMFASFLDVETAEMQDRTVQLTKAPVGFPAIPFPEKNQFSYDKWLLGRKLFFDPILSIDSSLSCASCHQPSKGFADDKATTPGVFQRPGKRNAPTLTNVAYNPIFLTEGSLPTLEMQILVPIQEHNEFNHNIVAIAEHLNKIPAYVALSKQAFDRLPDAFVITRAIATFERTLVSGNSKFDHAKTGGELHALAPKEALGEALFYSERTNCSSCHSGFNFTNYSFQNNGLAEKYTDEGRFHFTKDSCDMNLFKVPTLRNIALTAPYMHDGSLQTLEEVVEHYNSGGANHPQKSNMLKPLNLSKTEKAALVAFLHTLTDQSFATNPMWNAE